jgi:hypothetical protein
MIPGPSKIRERVVGVWEKIKPNFHMGLESDF